MARTRRPPHRKSPPTGGRGPEQRATFVRIIGGQWRRRRLAVADRPGLRPTPDRVRETLFNWLASRLEGATCWDLFAGTGALGMEALSRGAAHVVFIENDPTALAGIREALASLAAGERATVISGDACRPATLAKAPPADIVFIDPPFDAQLHASALANVTTYCKPDARLYLEYPADARDNLAALLDAGYDTLRQGRAAGVGFCLATPHAAADWSTP